MDRFLAIGSEDVECQYASLEQINSNRKKKKHQNVVEETRRKSGFDALCFPVWNWSSYLITHPESLFLYHTSVVRFVIMYVKAHQAACLWVGPVYMVDLIWCRIIGTLNQSPQHDPYCRKIRTGTQCLYVLWGEPWMLFGPQAFPQERVVQQTVVCTGRESWFSLAESRGSRLDSHLPGSLWKEWGSGPWARDVDLCYNT